VPHDRRQPFDLPAVLRAKTASLVERQVVDSNHLGGVFQRNTIPAQEAGNLKIPLIWDNRHQHQAGIVYCLKCAQRAPLELNLSLMVEFLDQGIDFRLLSLNFEPVVRVVPLSHDFLVGAPLLFDPGVILEVVDAFALTIAKFLHVIGGHCLQVAGFVGDSIFLAIFTEFFMHFGQAALIKFHRVGENGENDVILGQFVVLSKFNGGEQVGNAGEAKQIKLVDEV